MKKLFLGLGVLVLLTPLGMLASGTAWGEWGLEEIHELLGHVPVGLERFSGINPLVILPDYSLPGVPENFWAQAGVYILSGILGAGLCVGLIYLMNMGKK